MNETIDFYLSKEGTVYALALDAFKAFDRVNFSKLFEILLFREVNPIYLRFLMNMYTGQRLCVKYNTATSELFSVSNGVKQGGVLSPTLYSVYINGLLDELEVSGYGCKIGDVFVGCISYADDIILLCASVYGLRKMIHICENFASSHHIKFNGSKCNLMIYSRNNDEVNLEVKVFNEKVEIVNEIKYLGFMMSNNIEEDSVMENVIKDFNTKFNIFMGDFNKVGSVLKNELFSVYCTSFYGSHICRLNNVERVDVQWRKAIRRVWGLPYRAHNALLPHISKLLPPKILFLTRFIRYFMNNLISLNSVVKFVFRSAITNDTLLGNNFRYILYKCGYNRNDYEQGHINVDDIHKKIIADWIGSFMNDDIRLGSHNNELIQRRDAIEPWILTKEETQTVIDILAIS